ncbi:Dyp-type peroxidase domain-containing protein [Endozoicomonas sp. SCSIO W0465]|uniref:Dyp-type peroxidase n=1 Tax=Endozoicomonas sp. SCSIO W0465 TaxID=2918516 RepID=UPI002075331C|nr:Dyp-type peroxidase domain-containing protein [Endozoicomonas sp. SCSIO W0465]USE34967.1 Dyp-type peroxidase [Endozoicomonas sp. SCSIO W0465]
MLVIGGLLQPGDSGQTPGTILIATSTLHESTFPAWWEDVFCLLFAFFSNIRPRLEKKREEFLRLSGISGNIKTNVQSNYDCLMRFWTRTSYIHTQRYVHHLKEWEQCSLQDQETIMGRTKEDNIEFSAEQKAPVAHIKRVNLKDEQGKSMEILRHSMPYGDARESGLFFIAYGKTPEHFNRMLQAMIKADAG